MKNLGVALLPGVLVTGVVAVSAAAAPALSIQQAVATVAAAPPFMSQPGDLRDPGQRGAYASRAERALAHPLEAVTRKTSTPPSGDKHDYMSLGTYWWPDPRDPNAPYVRRDGEMNPARGTAAFDRSALARMASDAEALAQGYAATGDRRFAERAAAVVRAWFLDPATSMNPNMNYAQAVPGRNTGRAAGVIDGSEFQRVIDAVGLIDRSGALVPTDRAGLQRWFSRYVDWLTTSEIGRAERAAKNNHGLWYDSQLVDFALFAGRVDVAQQVLDAFPTQRLAKQIAADGSLPLELERTRSFHYSLYALEAAYNVAELGQRLGYDIWNWQGRDGRGLRKATGYLAAYRGRPEAWRHQELSWPAAELDALLARAPADWGYRAGTR